MFVLGMLRPRVGGNLKIIFTLDAIRIASTKKIWFSSGLLLFFSNQLPCFCRARIHPERRVRTKSQGMPRPGTSQPPRRLGPDVRVGVDQAECGRKPNKFVRVSDLRTNRRTCSNNFWD